MERCTSVIAPYSSITIIISIMLLFPVGTATADSWDNGPWYQENTARPRRWNQGDADYNSNQGNLGNLVSGLRDSRQGRVLSADTVDENGRPVHRIRILNNKGVVKGLRFDGATGRQLPRFRNRFPFRGRDRQ